MTVPRIHLLDGQLFIWLSFNCSTIADFLGPLPHCLLDGSPVSQGEAREHWHAPPGSNTDEISKSRRIGHATYTAFGHTGRTGHEGGSDASRIAPLQENWIRSHQSSRNHRGTRHDSRGDLLSLSIQG